jgi:L-fuculose-phosphate aldolase
MGSAAVEALQDRGAALIANHGMVAVAPSPAKALHITGLVERSATIVWGARQLGPIHPLPDDVNPRFAGIYRYLRQNPM